MCVVSKDFKAVKGHLLADDVRAIGLNREDVVDLRGGGVNRVTDLLLIKERLPELLGNSTVRASRVLARAERAWFGTLPSRRASVSLDPVAEACLVWIAEKEGVTPWLDGVRDRVGKWLMGDIGKRLARVIRGRMDGRAWAPIGLTVDPPVGQARAQQMVSQFREQVRAAGAQCQREASFAARRGHSEEELARA